MTITREDLYNMYLLVSEDKKKRSLEKIEKVVEIIKNEIINTAKRGEFKYTYKAETCDFDEFLGIVDSVKEIFIDSTVGYSEKVTNQNMIERFIIVTWYI